MNLKSQLEFYLNLRGLTPAALAKKCGIPKQRLSDLLAGIPPRKIETLKKIAVELHVSMDHLCFGEGEEKSPTPINDVTDLDEIIGDKWISGLFEVRLRRVRK